MSAKRIKELKDENAEYQQLLDSGILPEEEVKGAKELIESNNKEIAELEAKVESKKKKPAKSEKPAKKASSKKVATKKPAAKRGRKPASEKSEIETLEAMIDSGVLNEKDLKESKEKLAKLKGEKSPAKKSDDKPSVNKDDKGEFELIGGEKVYYSDKNYCEKVIAAWKKRKTKAEKAQRQYKTKPVMETIADNVGRAITKAVNEVPAKEIKDNPKKHIKNFEELEKAAKQFLNAFKKVLGESFSEKEVNDEMKSFEELIENLKKKYSPSKTK